MEFLAGLYTGAPEAEGHCGDGVGAVPTMGHRLIGLIGPHGPWSPGTAKSHGFGLRKGWLLLGQGFKIAFTFHLVVLQLKAVTGYCSRIRPTLRVFEPFCFEKPCRC